MITLDAGALIALERNDRAIWAALKLAALETEDVLVPSTVLAQVWRGRASQAMLSRALSDCIIAGFDELARAAGELCARTRTDDIADAHVALVASKAGGALYTSDPVDMRKLLQACRAAPARIVRC